MLTAPAVSTRGRRYLCTKRNVLPPCESRAKFAFEFADPCQKPACTLPRAPRPPLALSTSVPPAASTDSLHESQPNLALPLRYFKLFVRSFQGHLGASRVPLVRKAISPIPCLRPYFVASGLAAKFDPGDLMRRKTDHRYLTGL